MDFHLKQWTDHHHTSSSPSPSSSSSSSPALSLFSSEPTSTKPSPTAFPKMGGYFSMGQWQELEVQALIYKHMLTGSPVPPQLLHLLLNSTSSFYSLPTFSPSLYQSGGGYWGRGGMDPEPGRCRRTDGKKWRCSRDVVAGHKYCERHIHRGRNRSRKPVEIPTPTSAGAGAGSRGGGGYGGGHLKTNSSSGGAQPYTASSGGGGLSGHLHLNQRTSESTIENKATTYGSAHNEMLENDNNSTSDRILRPFFDDWPRTVQEQETRATSLSISVQGNSSSDFSLKLSTGPREEEISEHAPLNWGMLWGTHHAGSTGGPLAEALRSSTTTSASSPTSVLRQLQRGSTTTSETSYVTT